MRAFWVAAVIVAIDQATKIAVVRMMHLHESIPVVGDWLKFTFTENPGMAFGITVGPKGLIAVLALIATLLIAGYLWRIHRGYAPYRYSLSLVLGGALGNIIDRLFYGLIYDYGGLFQGHVVDFIHVDIWRGYVDPWSGVPFAEGQPWSVALFPIWNVADMAIVVGVVGILFFQQGFHEEIQARREAELKAEKEAASSPVPSEPRDGVDRSTPEDESPHAHPDEDREGGAAPQASRA
jgi:signal peptidase II